MIVIDQIYITNKFINSINLFGFVKLIINN